MNRELADFEARYGKLGGREVRTVPGRASTRAAGTDTAYELQGHAAVFNSPSIELSSWEGSFVEFVDPGAFRSVLSRSDLDTTLNWSHDDRWLLARTDNGTLQLSTDSVGLHYRGQVAPTSYAEDLRILVDRGDIRGASFCFQISRDEWRITQDKDGNEIVERTILEVGTLYDVCATPKGAYKAATTSLVRAHIRDYAANRVRSPGRRRQRGVSVTSPAIAIAKARAKAIRHRAEL